MKKLPGSIWPVMLTPFREDGSIDLKGLEYLTEFYIAAGASGLFANCLSSEMFHLSPEERITLTGLVIRFVKGRLPVVSTGTFTEELKENVDFINRLHDVGVDGVVVNSSQLCDEAEGEKVFKDKLVELVEATGKIPLGIYECPVPYKRLISKEMMEWIATTKRFNYFKDTSCDNEQMRTKLSVLHGTTVGLYNANTPTAVESLRDGAAGLSPIGANYYPELYSYLYNHALAPETETFRKVRRFLSVSDLVVHAVYPFSAKWFLQNRGLPITLRSRTPIPDPKSDEMIRLQELTELMKEIFEIAGIDSALKSI